MRCLEIVPSPLRSPRSRPPNRPSSATSPSTRSSSTPSGASRRPTGSSPARGSSPGPRTASTARSTSRARSRARSLVPATTIRRPGRSTSTGPSRATRSRSASRSSSPRATTRCPSLFPGFGALKGTDQTAMLSPDLPETVWFYGSTAPKASRATRSQDGKHSWEVPLAPFLGCLGVSPANGEARSTIVPDYFGGNMDCPEVRAGNTVYLGVRVPGALVSFGDGHYAMGDGEIMGTAIEGAMNVELTVDLDQAHARRRGRASRTRSG